jgi:hypothetical protein
VRWGVHSNGDGVLEKAEVMSIFSASGSDGSKKTGQISSKRFEVRRLCVHHDDLLPV